MIQEQQTLIKTYLSDETKLYQDWYQGLSQTKKDSSTIQFASQPSLESVKQRFQNWLKQKNCVDWGYSRKHEEFQTMEMLIVALTADGLTAALPIPTATLATMTILVAERHLNKICTECVEE